MSDIEFTDPIFCQDLATSDRQSLGGNQQENLFKSNFENYDQSLSYQSNHLGFSYSRKNRMSQTTASRQTPFIRNPDSKLLDFQSKKPQNLIDYRLSKDFRQSNNLNLHQISENEEFECQGCRQTPDRKCQICRGSKTINGNSNLIKFLQYVIAFKMRVKDSYKQKKIISIGRSSVNNFCSDFFNARDSNPNLHQTYSIKNRSSLPNKKTDPKEIQDQLTNFVALHQNYICDGCQTTPIVGTRFHCTECEDYDECEKCYKKEHSHSRRYPDHKIAKIECCGKKKQLQGIVNLISLSQTQARVSLRPPPSIKSEMSASMVSRSALH